MKTYKSTMPRPPICFERHIMDQLARFWRLLLYLPPFHRKILHMLLIFLIIKYNNWCTDIQYLGIVLKTKLTNISLSARDKEFIFQLDNFHLTLFNRKRLVMESDSLILIENFEMLHPRIVANPWTSC